MYVILKSDELAHPDAYPGWCDLSWFQNVRHATGRVEQHYHDLPEVYLWHEGQGEAVIDGRPVAMRYGAMAYTVAGAQHSINPAGLHSNTGIVPRLFSGCRCGHLHTEETAEQPHPRHPSFWLMPEANAFITPVELPRHCFVRHATCGRFAGAQSIFSGKTAGWLALLVREGQLRIRADNREALVSEGHLLITPQGTLIEVCATGPAEVARADGWPDWKP